VQCFSLLVVCVFATAQNGSQSSVATIKAYVRDSACVHRFHEVTKPLPNGCLEECVRGGSPLVFLTKDGQVFQPISATMPDIDVRKKLLPYTGKFVKVTGHIYRRGGSKAIAVEKIEETKD
jgi:hypothetical protein